MPSHNVPVLGAVVASLLASRGDAFGFGYFSRTNQGTANATVPLPATANEAEGLGWFLAVRADGSPCRQGLGVEYTEGAPSHSASRPLSLFFAEDDGGVG